MEDLEIQELPSDVRRDLADTAELLRDDLRQHGALIGHVLRNQLRRFQRLIDAPSGSWHWTDVTFAHNQLSVVRDVELVMLEHERLRHTEMFEGYRSAIGKPWGAWSQRDHVLFDAIVRQAEE